MLTIYFLFNLLHFEGYAWDNLVILIRITIPQSFEA